MSSADTPSLGAVPPLPAYFDDWTDRTREEVHAYARAAIAASMASQATAELLKLPKGDIGPTDEMFGLSEQLALAYGRECYEAGRASRAQSEGWMQVPVEPTSEMLDAACEEEVHTCEQGDPYYSDRPMSETDARKVWQAMCAASVPKPATLGETK